MDMNKEIQELFCSKHKSLTILMDNLKEIFLQKNNKNFCVPNSIDMELFDKVYFDEIQHIANDVNISFGKTIKQLKCVLRDEGFREHEIFIEYSSPRKYRITSVNVPHLPYQDKDYNNLNEIIDTFQNHVNSLSNYFFELEEIDQFCSVRDPLHPTYKDNYRKIAIDERTWLHIEVTPYGAAKNIYLIGQSKAWHDKLQKGVLSWDHDKSIVDNITSIFDINTFSNKHEGLSLDQECAVAERQCAICLCEVLPDNPSVPQPLCQNISCGVYYHRSCLYEWLLSSAGGREPSLGVVNGTCPTCFHPIACSLFENF